MAIYTLGLTRPTLLQNIFRQFFLVDDSSTFHLDHLAQTFLDLFNWTSIHPRIMFLPDFLAISRLLNDTESVFKLLDQLEASLAKYALMKIGSDQLPVDENNPYKCNKILSGFLYQWARNNGFSSKAKILRGISREDFCDLLKTHTFFKDNAIFNDSFYHGLWSHALQQYLVFEMQKQSNNTFLQHNPIDIYDQLGTDREGGRAIWNVLFDHNSGKSFSYPDHLTEILLSADNAGRWPILSGSIKRRYDKINGLGLSKYKEHLTKNSPDIEDGVIRRTF